MDARNSTGIQGWLDARTPVWRDRIEVVAIDPSAARITVDHWHLVRLANLMVTKVRQRVAQETKGHRGRDSLQSSSDKTRPIPNRLYVFRYRNMMAAMARAATTSDAFNAIAEPRRRDILALLRAGERPVTDLAQRLGMSQPRASKHLRVLREVGLVRVRGAGKQRLYGLDARGLRPVHEWVGGFERFWNESFDRLDTYVQDLKQTQQEE